MGAMQVRLAALAGALACAASAAAQVAAEKVLFEKTSAFNHIMVTEDGRGLRTLWFERGGARQSVVKPGDPDHVELPYAQAMPAGLFLVEKPQRILIVGLGGGTIPAFLHKHYPKLAIDVVDIDPDVVDAARKYFGFREDAALKAHVDDGRKFIENSPGKYDALFLDAFGADNVPRHLTTREFLQACRRALAEGGLVVGNIWSRASNPLYDSMVRTYQDVFDEVYILDVQGAGNRIVFALPRKQRVRAEDLARRAREESKLRQFRFDVGEYVERGFRPAGRDGASGRVLIDREIRKAAG